MATEDDSDVPETGAVFTFGKSQFGDNAPNKFWIRDDHVVSVCCGDEHTTLVTENGKIFTFGVNEWGQLGLGHNKIVKKPSRIKALKSEKIIKVACGRSHTLVATESGKLYSFGFNSDGQLGLGHTDSVNSPSHIEGLDEQRYSMLGAGVDFSVALTDEGDVYVWGNNGDGQLGLGEEKEAWQPVKLSVEEKVKYIACGYYHVALVTESGDLYTFGEAENGKLGQGDSPPDNTTPQKVDGIDDKVAVVACGGKHTAVITESGKLYTFGEGSNGQLGHGTSLLSTDTPVPVTWPNKNIKLKKVSCGENHTAVISEKGRIYCFGDGRHGKLALGEENFANQFKPILVDRFTNFVVEEVSCGGCHLLVSAKHRVENGDIESEEDEEESEDEHFTHKSLELNGTVRNSMDLNGSLSARNRRREKLPDPGDTINRTMPPLNGTLSGKPLPALSATLPSLGSHSHNHLNRGKLPSLRGAPPPKKDEDEESGLSSKESEDDQPAIRRTTAASTKASMPLPRPRLKPKAQEPAKESDHEEKEDKEREGRGKSEDGEKAQSGHESSADDEKNDKIIEAPIHQLSDQDEDSMEKNAGNQSDHSSKLDDSPGNTETSPIKASPVPALRSKPKHRHSEDDDESEKEQDKAKKHEDSREESEAESEDDQKKKKKSKKDKKKDTKKGGIFGRQRKMLESDSEEDEIKNEESGDEEESKSKKKKPKDKKKDKKAKESKKKRKSKDDEESENDEDKSDAEKSEKEDSEDDKKLKKSKKKSKKKKDESEEESGDKDQSDEGDKKKKSKKDSKKKKTNSEESAEKEESEKDESGDDKKKKSKKKENRKKNKDKDSDDGGSEAEKKDAKASEDEKEKDKEKEQKPPPKPEKKSRTCVVL